MNGDGGGDNLLCYVELGGLVDNGGLDFFFRDVFLLGWLFLGIFILLRSVCFRKIIGFYKKIYLLNLIVIKNIDKF